MTRRKGKGKPKRRRAVVVTLGTKVRRRGKGRTEGVIVGWDLRTGSAGRWIIDEPRTSRP